MLYTLVGKMRNTFPDENGRLIPYGRIYVQCPFDDNADGEFCGLECSEIKLDYDSVGSLPDNLPCDINIEFDRRGRIRRVELVKSDGK